MKTQILLEQILEALCHKTGRDIFVMLPEKQDERISYLKGEIIKTMEQIK
jgi:hypothetical protein